MPIYAKGVYLRNKHHFADDKLKQQMDDIDYDESQDCIYRDRFGPISEPVEDYLKIPNFVKIKTIRKESEVEQLDELLGSEYLGMDSEWKPVMNKFEKVRVAIFQISSEKTSFLIDMVELAQSKVLDEKLKQIFLDQSIIKIGFSFKSDIEVFSKALSTLTFYKYIKNFVDAQIYFGRVCTAV